MPAGNPPRVDISSAHHLCWSCRQETGTGPFCNHCVKIQPVEELGSYFALFRLEKTFDIDPVNIKKTFFELSRKFHPDFFTVRSDEERLLARNNTAYLNTALKVLLDPVERAEYLLSHSAGAYKSNPAPPQELFEEILEIGDLLEKKTPNEKELELLSRALDRFNQRKEELLKSLSPLFARLLDGADDVKDEIISHLDQIKFLKKTAARIVVVLAENGSDG